MARSHVLAAVLLLTFSGLGAACLCNPGVPAREASEARPPDGSGASLDVRLHPAEAELEPPAELWLKDPRGRMSGVDPRTGRLLTEIPASWYEQESLEDAESGAPGPRTTVLHIHGPEPGRYQLEVHGRAHARYHLEVLAVDGSLETSHALRKAVPITPDEVHRYTLDYSDRPGSPVELTGPETAETGS